MTDIKGAKTQDKFLKDWLAVALSQSGAHNVDMEKGQAESLPLLFGRCTINATVQLFCCIMSRS